MTPALPRRTGRLATTAALLVLAAACVREAPRQEAAGRESAGRATTGRESARAPAAVAEAPAMPAGSPVVAELISDVERVQPGVLFRLGILLTIEDGWHVHWRNPGPAPGGRATRVEFDLPEYFHVRESRWPTPRRIERDGLVAFGYGRELLIDHEVRASNLDAEDEVWRLRARVEWMACRRECVPGSADLEVGLPHSISGTRLEHFVNERTFARWAGRFPAGLHDPVRPFTASLASARVPDADASAGARAPGHRRVVELRWRDTPVGVEWFPDAATLARHPKADVRTTGRTTRIVLAPSPDPPDHVRGVVAYTRADGSRGGAELAVDVGGSRARR